MHKQLFENKWIEVREVGGYVYSHESSCGGQKVAILPYRLSKNGVEFLLRKELTPCWGSGEYHINSITGGVEDGGILATVFDELWEETGYTATAQQVRGLGSCFGVKSADTIYHLYAVDLTGANKTGDALGMSDLESREHCEWFPDIDESNDPLVYVMHRRLIGQIKPKAA